jgi:hypothetical protein
MGMSGNRSMERCHLYDGISSEICYSETCIERPPLGVSQQVVS